MENLKLRITFPNGSTAEVDAGPAKGPDGAKQTRATLSDAHGNKISLSGKLDGELALHDEDEQYTITIRHVPKEENEEELYSSWPPHEQNPLPEIRRTVPKTFRVSMCVDPENNSRSLPLSYRRSCTETQHRRSRMDGKWSLLDGDGNTYTVTNLERNKKASPEPCRTASMIKVPREPSFAMQKMQCRARNLLEQFDKKTGR